LIRKKQDKNSNRKERKERKEKGVIATASAAWREAIQKTIPRGDAEKTTVILRAAKRSRRIQTLHGFRDYARNDDDARFRVLRLCAE
jgi:hypothetical protein